MLRAIYTLSKKDACDQHLFSKSTKNPFSSLKMVVLSL